MAQYLVDILGDSLVTQPLKSHPCDDNCPLPSPNDLKYKILIKNKKLHQNPTGKATTPNGQPVFRKTDSVATVTSDLSSPGYLTSTPSVPTVENSNRRKQAVLNEIRDGLQSIEFDSQLSTDSNRNAVLLDDEEHSSEEDEILPIISTDLEAMPTDPLTAMNSTATYPTNSDALAESKATKAMSDLVHYVVPVRFATFARSEERKRSYEISSFAEDKAQSLIREHGREFVAYNQRQLSRIYPRGTRFDSSNYNPYLFWPVGCQMVALNYQTMGRVSLRFSRQLKASLSLSLSFRYADASESRFVLVQSCLWLPGEARLALSINGLLRSERSNERGERRGLSDRNQTSLGTVPLSGSRAHPRGHRNVRHVRRCQQTTRVSSACQTMEWLPGRLRRHRSGDRRVPHSVFQGNDLLQAFVEQRTSESSQVILPEMASLRFAVSEEDGTFIGQSFLPVAHLRPGYRHVVLRNQMNIPVHCASLFIYIRKDVHVDAENRGLIAQLVSPTSNAVTSKEAPKPSPYKSLSEQRSHSISDLDSLRRSNEDSVFASDNLPHRHQYPSTTEINPTSTIKRRNQSTPFVDANWHHNRLIASSQLHESERLCQLLLLQEIEQSKTFKREKEKIQGKIRRASVEHEKVRGSPRPAMSELSLSAE